MGSYDIFTLTILIDTTEGRALTCDLYAGEEEKYGYLKALVSPSELGRSASVPELLDRLRASVIVDHEGTPDEEEEWEDFMDRAGRLGSMEEIAAITVSSWVQGYAADETEAYTYYRTRDVTVHAKYRFAEQDDADNGDEGCGDYADYWEGAGGVCGELDFRVQGPVREGIVKTSGGRSRACLPD